MGLVPPLAPQAERPEVPSERAAAPPAPSRPTPLPPAPPPPRPTPPPKPSPPTVPAFTPPLDAIGAPPQEAVASAATLQELESRICGCLACPLGSGRIRFVFGEGSPRARLMFIGEGPGRDEDLQGRPFVGKAGELLDKMIEAIKLKREDIYIANVVKCRPPDNRTPTPQEAQTCLRYLQRQIELIQPGVIVTLGATPLKELLGISTGITKLRGQWQQLGTIPVMPTFHPAYVLRQYTQDVRRAVWADLVAAKTWLDEH